MTTEIFFMIMYFIIAMFFMVMYIRLKHKTDEIKTKMSRDNHEIMHFLLTASGEDLLVYQYLYIGYLVETSSNSCLSLTTKEK